MDQGSSEGGGRLVLVAEDNEINILYIETVLEDAGYRVVTARTGVEALAAFETGPPPSLVLMDIQMPGMDGIECARRMRADADARKNSTPIVALTGYALPQDRRKFLDAGMIDFLAKPFEDEDLLGIVRRRALG
jgi:two-component system, sensor histidine kinase RetS